jgi:hypothetical protein
MKRIRIALIAAFVVALLALALTLSHRRAKPAPVATPRPALPATPAPAQPPKDTAPPETLLTPPRGYLALSAAIDSGALPEPLPLPRGAPDRQAVELASAVFARDSNSTAAIYAAVLASGYGVRKRDGTIVRTVDPGQGIVLEEFEVAGMAKLYGLGYGVTLKHLGDSFRRAEPWKDLKLEDLLLEGLREAAVDSTPEVKFWALFIAELGRRSAQPYDLLSEPDHSKIRLDAIQLQFLLTRIAADYAFRYTRTASAAPTARVSLASWPPAQSPSAQSPSAKCDLGTPGEWTAIGVTTVFGLLTERMGGAAERYGQAVQRANLMLVIAKFIATYALLDQELHIETGQLIRTKSILAGQTRKLTVRVSIQETWTQYVNCARLILNHSGLDLVLPNSGPVKDVWVWWAIEQGRETLVFFPYAPEGGTWSSTNDQGIAEFDISGMAQAQDLMHRRIVRVDKTASVRTSAAVKSTRLESLGDVAETAGDYGSLVLAFFTGDPHGAIVGLITENFYREAWGYSEPFEFTVVDWEPCENVWSGTIDYSESFITVGSWTRPGINMHRWNEMKTYSAHTTIWQSRKDAQPAGQSTADAMLSRLEFSTGLNQCYYVGTQFMQLKGSGAGNAYLSVSINSSGEYSVGYTLPLVDAAGTYTQTSKKEGPQCNNPFNMGKTDTSEESQQIGPEANVQITGHVNPDAPDALSGAASEEREIRDGVRRATVKWTLKRCPGNLN